ncbi:hypothetical protein HNP84_007887 [Thermocatellispora tengchongensis]|uniref:DUF732 domain-containing protein n=1 Tax=Thermocatellispora tengchongensis TaxID=1073253 RepID=A0A840P9S3_9ACTN|nr:hypothetical protein [Thermocatellispora tengchongensis]MBB5138134.1 hypothetical protein [Thermocatellispora tengchongensis]
MAAALVAGCGTPSGPATDTATTTSQDTAESTGVPTPDAEQKKLLLDGLAKIDPALENERYVDRAQDTCAELLGGINRDEVTKNIQDRFGGEEKINLTLAGRIITLIEGSFCHQ